MLCFISKIITRLLFLNIFTVSSFKFCSLKARNDIKTKSDTLDLRRVYETLLISSFAISYNTILFPSNVLAISEEPIAAVAGTLVRSSPATESLTAADLLKSDIEFYTRELKDMSFVLRNVEDIINNRDYEDIRSVLRQEPVRNLRKTSKYLKKYLPSKDIQEKYEVSYQTMISAVDDLDFKATQRFRKEGVPKEGEQDSELLNILKTVILKLDEMISVVPSS